MTIQRLTTLVVLCLSSAVLVVLVFVADRSGSVEIGTDETAQLDRDEEQRTARLVDATGGDLETSGDDQDVGDLEREAADAQARVDASTAELADERTEPSDPDQVADLAELSDRFDAVDDGEG